VSADCVLSTKDIKPVMRIILYRSGARLYPLRVDVVPTGLELELICNSADVVKVTCNRKGQFEPSLPTGLCLNPIPAIAQRFRHSSCPKTMFRVGYKFDNQFIELYRSCYDENIKRAHFSIHHLYNYTLSKCILY